MCSTVEDLFDVQKLNVLDECFLGSLNQFLSCPKIFEVLFSVGWASERGDERDRNHHTHQAERSAAAERQHPRRTAGKRQFQDP